MLSSMCADTLFASLDADLNMERIAGGNETEVYCTDDRQHVVKVKSEGGSTLEEALLEAQVLRAAADLFADALGPEHTIPTYFIVARNSQGEVQPVAIQPYIRNAQPLFDVDYRALDASERRRVATQLRSIIRCSLDFYRKTGAMPDLYGRLSHSKAERKRRNAPCMLPHRMWSFLVQRTLLRSHNLLLTPPPEHRIILVDYDPVKRSTIYRYIYYKVRRVLFLRDYLLIALMERTGWAFKPRMERCLDGAEPVEIQSL
jgi:hypothetical protein